MSPEKLAEALRLAREWDAAHPREPSPPSPLNRLRRSARLDNSPFGVRSEPRHDRPNARQREFAGARVGQSGQATAPVELTLEAVPPNDTRRVVQTLVVTGPPR